ncbi:fatty acid-binding protein, liver-like [Lytechinus variegatus]|uniref:fatty acid-binding protein, liver-like n=1 Tax=Lytechinus variegatus TaxID=7654 RepID=UPI001BB1EC6E|nr:fatty acid-binding protein, liver-like [Lytechinus variegatus]
MADFSGKWVFDHAENMETLADKLKIDPAKIPKDRSTTVEITQNGDNFHIVSVGGGRTRDMNFTIGKSFVDPDILELRGKEIQVTPSWNGSKLVLTGPKGTNSAAREMVGSQMVVTFNWEGVVGKRFFNRA